MTKVGATRPAGSYRHLPTEGLQEMLAKKIGGPKAVRLMNQFRQTERGWACVPYEEIPRNIRPSKKFHMLGQKLSPILLSSLDEGLRFSPVVGRPEGTTKDRKLPFLENYLLIPTRSGKMVFISDDHNHAAFAWSLAVATGLISHGATLLHVDSHLDNGLCGELLLPGANRGEVEAIFGQDQGWQQLFLQTKYSPFRFHPWLARQADQIITDPVKLAQFRELVRRQETELGAPWLNFVARYIWQNITIAGFIAFAANEEMGKVIGENQAHFILPEGNSKKLYYGTDFYDIDRPSIDSFDGVMLSLERAQEAIDKARAAGRSVIVDIDLDFFNPYYPECPAESALSRSRARIDPVFSFEEAIRRVIEVARQADFITIATSPNYFLVNGSQRETRKLLRAIVSALNGDK